MPTVRQMAKTLPCSFKERYHNTYAIIDGSEIFIETPSDLHMQFSTWSQYKHHNTTNYLVIASEASFLVSSKTRIFYIYNYIIIYISMFQAE